MDNKLRRWRALKHGISGDGEYCGGSDVQLSRINVLYQKKIVRYVQELETNYAETPCNTTAFVVNLKHHTRERPSVGVCERPELFRCVHVHSCKIAVAAMYP
jgi:hypothetical protein